MEAIIGGALVGAVVVTLGRPLVSGVTEVLSPVTNGVLKAGNVACDAVAGTLAATGAWVSGLVGGNGREGEAEGEGMLVKVEEVGKDLVWDFAADEAATFIKMALVLAL